MRVKKLVTAALGATALVASATVPLAAGAGAAEPQALPASSGTRAADLDTDSMTLREMAPRGFRIGTALAGGGHHVDQPYPDPFPNDRRYRRVMAREFNSLSPENQMKWEFIHPEQDRYRFGPADRIVRFSNRHGQVVRGHTLLWHNQNPTWLTEGDFTADELRQILRRHIRTVVGRYAGEIQQWDVANEIFDQDGNLRTEENIWIRELGPGIIAKAFKWAHKADPHAKLFFNDYGVEDINAKSDAYYELVQELRAEGVPVDGFSVQGHLSTQYGFPGSLQANLQRFSDLGVETAITEVDVRMVLPEGAQPTSDQLEQQADYYRQMLEACLSVESCNSFTLWGFVDKYSWVPVFFTTEGAATVMWDDFERKPAYYALLFRLAEQKYGATPEIITSARGSGRTLSLTFDDGPDPDDTRPLLRVLRRYDVKAVFCLWGDFVKEHPGIVRRIAENGHTLCNHSMHHDNMSGWTQKQIRRDLKQTSATIREVVPDAEIPFFRAPYGAWGLSPEVAVELGMQPLGWRFHVEDWEEPGEDVLYDKLVERATPGAVVLLHDGPADRSGTVGAVERFIPAFQAEGWRFTLPRKIS